MKPASLRAIHAHNKRVLRLAFAWLPDDTQWSTCKEPIVAPCDNPKCPVCRNRDDK